MRTISEARPLRMSAVDRGFVPRPCPPVSPPRVRLEVLDAVRGFAALCVVLFHIREALQPVTATLSRPFHLLAYLNNHGHDAVVVFIVLSGFVLTIPVARSPGIELRGGFADYLKRRARRILPPFYAALAIFFSLGLLWHLDAPMLVRHGLSASDNPFVSANATPQGLASHLVLLHNLHRSWDLSVDSPMWSVATEFQIYFIFPLILLPLWRNVGLIAAVIGGFAIGMIPVLVLPRETNYGTSSPWLLGDFALGIAAAACAFSPSMKRLPQKSTIWGAACILVIALIGGVQIRFPHLWHLIGEWHKDMATGLAVALLLVYLARCQTSPIAHRPIVFRLLDSKAAVVLGAFSYSLYLVHLPLITLLDLVLSRLSVSGQMHVFLLYGLGTTLSLAAGYGFYLVFERPFCRPPPQPARA